jgi:muramoyltetrapeptide carboxypeptidase
VNQRLLPASLKPGDTVAVITPAGHPQPAAFANGVERLRSWGLIVREGANIALASDTPELEAMCAGPDAARAHDLQRALTDPHVRAVLVGRGGYGVMRILDSIDWNGVRQATPRHVLGFSDITAVHEAIRVHTNWSSTLGIHVAGALGNEVGDAVSIDATRAWLFNHAITQPFDDAMCLREGVVVAPMIGGNLALLASLCGSVEGTPPVEPFIAVLEDVNESPYRVDRMLTQLLRSGYFARCVGVVAGTWEKCGDVEAVLRERLNGVPGPIVMNAAFGHGVRHLPVPLGIPVRFEAFNGKMSLAIQRQL